MNKQELKYGPLKVKKVLKKHKAILLKMSVFVQIILGTVKNKMHRYNRGIIFYSYDVYIILLEYSSVSRLT